MNTTIALRAKDFILANAVPVILALAILCTQVVKAHLGLYSSNPTIITLNIVLFTFFAASLLYPKSRYYEAFRKLVTIVVPLAIALVVVGLYLKPRHVDTLAMEDGPIENLSAIMWFSATIIWFVFFLSSLNRHRWEIAAVSMVMGLIFAVIGFEEISWGQRILNIESTEFFLENNIQAETNLHNLSTSLSEKIFYTTGILSLVIVPFFRDRLAALLPKIKLGWLNIFLPSPWILLPFSVIIGLSGRVMVGWVSILFVSVFSILILIYEADRLFSSSQKWGAAGRVLCLALAVVTMLTVINLNYGEMGLRTWLASEYLELFIGVGMLVYTVDFMFRNTKLIGHSYKAEG